jgi:two-component system LytT family sensor kinase
LEGPDRGIMAHKNPWMIWVWSFGLWTFVAVANGVTIFQFDRSIGRYMSLRDEITLPLINNLIYAALTPVVFGLALRHPIQRTNWMRRTGVHLVGSLGFTVAHVALRSLVYPVWDPRIRGFAYIVWNPHTYVFNVQWVLINRLFFYNVTSDIFSVYLPIVLIAQAVWYQKRFREREVRTFELEAQLAKAHLQALKSQLQPHFLFNTLHSISALMLTDVQAADRMMTRLSDLLRMSLENNGVQETSLSRELEFVGGYLEIEKVRFEERLEVVLEIPPDTLDARVPHLLLQPLVENAVRHGISRRSAAGEIRIGASHDDHSLYLRVRDNGPGLGEHEARPGKVGLGLVATRERLQTLYGSDQSVDVRSLPEGGAEACVRIPFRMESSPVYEVLPGEPEPTV